MPAVGTGQITLDLESPSLLGRRWLHVESGARDRYGFPPNAFTIGGRLLEVDFHVAERITASMNAARTRSEVDGPLLAPGELAAAALLHELAHALLELFDWRPTALTAVEADLGPDETAALFTKVRERFPPPAAPTDPKDTDPKDTYPEDIDSEDTVTEEAGVEETAAADSQPSPATTLEELLLLGEAHLNPALEPLSELFAFGPLATDERVDLALANTRAVLAGIDVSEHDAGTSLSRSLREGDTDSERSSPADHRPGSNLLTLLRAPARRHPGSLDGQLTAALSLWAPLLGERFARLLERALRGLDQLREERTFVAGIGGGAAGPAEFEGGKFEPSGRAAYSHDQAWMAQVVIVAKNAFVWLEQLSSRYDRRIERLDDIPDEELGRLAEQGFNTVWLVGVWQRSEASRTIKRLRGQPHAEASAYAIFDYVIASELGGEGALDALSARAAGHGLRLAGDMVPNHTGIDARWVEERPDWYLRLDEPPYDSYSFDGPDLTPGRSIEVRLEDGYYDGSDAAVVFKRRDRGSGEVSYLYHGNDGTAMPWNDTAQLDYLNPEVRSAIIDTIVAVARRFKVIRFDAAMTLVKRHIRRLWHPPPGQGGAIPSRSRHALDELDFERAMPHEFWRQVVEELAVRAPDTLLVAEAFWLLESYFVRTLGLHRVYNSAFMHLLAAERNAEHRRLLRQTLTQAPGDLERLVNYLTTPDEESAAETFGRGDKYFGAAVMLATLPGTPLFGHGQVDGLAEKYGMEFRAPRLDESPDEALRERHRRVVAPLLARRAEFATVDGFIFADFVDEGGSVVEDVYAYLFGRTPQRATASLVLFNNSARRVAGRLVAAHPAAGEGAFGDLAAALRLGEPAGAGQLVYARHDSSAGDRTGDPGDRAASREPARLQAGGLTVTLEPYQALVYLDIGWGSAETAGAQDAAPVASPASVRGPGVRRRRPDVAVLATVAKGAGRRRAAFRRRR